MMTASAEPIEGLVRRWLQQDRDEETRSEIETLYAERNYPELEARLRKRIAFGTAGLRSSMQAGFAHMNSLTVLQASHGLANYIKAQPNSEHGRQRQSLSVAIGYDARHNSEKFARLTAAAFLDKGFSVLWFGRYVHTPLVPFTVSHLGAAAGVMVTASHNPKADNGYKVYWANGCQIIPPRDVEIAHAIAQVTNITTWDTSVVDTHAAVMHVYADVAAAYFDSIRALVSPLPSLEQQGPAAASAFAYTPLHGVGLPFMQQIVHMLWPRSNDNTSNGSPMHVVAAQAAPDPEFPTVPFPNPEERGALTATLALAQEHGLELVLANDPDADRFAAAVRVDEAGAPLRQLTGNQLGILLAAHVLETHAGERAGLVMLASAVSSRMLAAMAAAEGFRFHETLTGFKWLGNEAQRLRADGLEPAFAYEEAIGYMFPGVVWDKDGVAAAAAFLAAAQRWRRQGLTPWRKLERLYARYGCFEDANTYVVSPSPQTTDRVFGDIRTLNAGVRPETIGRRRIARWRDLTVGYDSGTDDHRPVLPVDASAQMITCELDDDVVFTVRGSGTEPKIKFYIEAKRTSSDEAKTCANEVLNDLLAEWFKPGYGLRLAGT